MTIEVTSQPVDFYQIDHLLNEDDRALRDRVRAFCDEEIIPIIGDYWERAEFPFELVPKLAELNLAGGTIPGYGCPGLSSVANGIVSMELSRGDGSFETFLGVTSGLAMGSIYYCGSEEQRQRWLPAMARIETIGAFGLTEPNVGSDASHIQTTARRSGDGWLLTGEKKWIGNATFADVIVIWARNEETNQVNGFVVEKGTPGYDAQEIGGKISKRALINAHITMNNVLVPETNRLQNANSFKDTANVLKNTRYGVAWEAVGHAMAAFEIARDYAIQREQFGRPIARFQLIQEKLVHMLGDLTTMQLMCLRLSQLRDAGTMTEGQASLAKQHCCARARHVVALGREILGGNGILLEYHMARHFADMEAVYTYEGTNEINTMVVGREVTGLAAFV